MNDKTLELLNRLATPTSLALGTGSGSTAFARLSPLAQELIVNAVIGEYDKSGPPDIPEAVKAEIAAWAREDESPNNAGSNAH